MCRSAGVARDCLHVWAVGASFSGSSRFAVLYGGNEKVLEDSGSSVRRIIRGPFGSLLSCVLRCSAISSISVVPAPRSVIRPDPFGRLTGLADNG